jgi:choline dehydrogenase-like flavoprotein
MTTIDARKLDANTEIETDLCIIGAGAAGISIACELAGKGIRVALIEAGDREYSRASQSLYSGLNVGLPIDPPTASRFRVLGGSTTAWAGQCGTLNRDDFEVRPWIPYSGWPFSFEVLRPYYQRAQTFMGFGPDETAWLAAPDRPVLRLKDNVLEPKMFRFCETTDFRVLHSERLERAENIITYLNANVVDIEQSKSGRRILGLIVRTLEGRRHIFRANVFVLAAGGLENVRLMLSSNREAGGIGNDADIVGRFFMDHPFIYSGVAHFHESASEKNAHVNEGYDRLASMHWRMAAIQFAEDWVRNEQLVNCAVHFLRRPAFKTTKDYNSRAGVSLNALSQAIRAGFPTGPHWSRYIRRVIKGSHTIAKSRFAQLRHLLRPRSALALRVTLENTPDPASRVYLTSRTDKLGTPLLAVDWRIGEVERRSLDRFHQLLGDSMIETKLGSIELRFEEDDTGWPSSLSSGKHHMGGTRMHNDRNQGVVNSDCRVHGIDNLFIAGSSVFPTGGYANPTFTIIALSIKLADHLRRELS